MRPMLCSLVAASMLLAVPALPAQDAAATATPVSVVPHLIKYSGTLPSAPGNASVVEVKFALYEGQTGGDPLWTETQQVALDAQGKYSVLLGSTTTAGLPDTAFATGQARWLGVTLSGEQESARSILVATPYSLKASDSETLGGHPAADFKLKNAKPDAATDISQLTDTGGITFTNGGTGPTVGVGLDETYLEDLGNELYPQLGGNNTLTGTNTYTAGNLKLGSSPVLSVANVLAGSEMLVTPSGNTVTIALNGPTLLTLGNEYYAQLAAGNIFSGTQALTSNGTATSGGGKNSFSLQFTASAYNSSSSAAEPMNFAWKAEPTGNNTASPAGTMNLLFASGTNSASETGFNIASTGLVTFPSAQTFPGTATLSGNNSFTGSNSFSKAITFASGQTFPGTGTGDGTITGVTTTSPLTGSGTSGSVAIGLNTSTLETTLDGIYPQLSAANTFAGANTFSEPVTFAASQTFPGTALLSGGNTFSGTQVLTSVGTATASGGHDSYSLQLTASTYDSATSAAVPVNFVWKAEHLGNNTASPSGTINLLYGTGTGVSETGLNISSAGVINFASGGQTSPASAPRHRDRLNGVYPQLAANSRTIYRLSNLWR
jgi:hypothetical protein